jgi:hypothetical protein
MYSICALVLRNSSSAQRLIDSISSGLILSKNRSRSAMSMPPRKSATVTPRVAQNESAASIESAAVRQSHRDPLAADAS